MARRARAARRRARPAPRQRRRGTDRSHRRRDPRCSAGGQHRRGRRHRLALATVVGVCWPQRSVRRGRWRGAVPIARSRIGARARSRRRCLPCAARRQRRPGRQQAGCRRTLWRPARQGGKHQRPRAPPWARAVGDARLPRAVRVRPDTAHSSPVPVVCPPCSRLAAGASRARRCDQQSTTPASLSAHRMKASAGQSHLNEGERREG